MDAIGWLVPIHLARVDLHALSHALIAVFDGQGVAAQDYGDSMERVAVPRGSLAGREPQPSHQIVSAMVELFLGHG